MESQKLEMKADSGQKYGLVDQILKKREKDEHTLAKEKILDEVETTDFRLL